MTPLPTPWQEEGATTTAGTDTVLTEQADATTEQPTTLDTVSAALGLDDVDDVDEGCGKPNSGDDEEDDEDVDDESAMEGESGATGSLRDKMLKIMAQSRIKIAHLIPAGKKGPAGLTLAAAKKLIKESVTEAKAKADGEAHGDDEMEEEQEEASASDADDDDTEEETRGEQERAATTAEADPQAEADDEQEEGSVFERLAGLDEAKDSAKFFASLSMSDLRKRQGIVKQQQATASEQYEAAKDPGTKRRMSRAVDKLAKTEAALTQAVAAKSKTTQGSRA